MAASQGVNTTPWENTTLLSQDNHMCHHTKNDSSLDNLDFTANVLKMYGLPILLALGTLGNILCIVTLRSAKFRLTSTGFLLTALAFSDMTVLYTGALRQWLIVMFSLDVREMSTASCKIQSFCTYYSVHLSAWTLVLITIERLLSVIIPTRFNTVCSRKRMVLGWILTAAILLLIDIYLLTESALSDNYYPGENVTRCVWRGRDYSNSAPLTDFLYWSDFCLSFLLPTCLILVANCVLCYKLYGMSSLGRVVSISSGQSSTSLPSSSVRKKSSLTLMLVVVSLMFVITTLPINICFLVIKPCKMDLRLKNFIYACFNSLYYLNNAMNFFLYFISGSRFREAALNLLMCTESRKRAAYVKDLPDKTRTGLSNGGHHKSSIPLLSIKLTPVPNKR